MRTLIVLTLPITFALSCASGIAPAPPFEPERPSEERTQGGSKTMLVRTPAIPLAERIEGDSVQGTDFGPGTSSWFAGGRAPTVNPTAAMIRDPETNLLLPDGWQRVIERRKGAQTLVYHERAPEETMSLLGMTLLEPRGPANVRALINRMSSRLEGANIVRETVGPQGILFVELEGTRRGAARTLGMIVRKTPERQAIAFFEAPSPRYTTLGAASLLFAFASGTAPLRVAPPEPETPPEPLIAEREVQEELLKTPAPVPRSALIGTWYEGMEPPKDPALGRLGALSGLGQGNILTFASNGTYTWLHRYDHSFKACTNEIESVERGTYEVAGGRVTMRPVDFDALLCPCCKGNPRPMTRRPSERVFRLGMHSGTKHLAMRGACPGHMVRCEAQGEASTLWLGLTRAR